MTIETERLVLRPTRMSDALALFAFLGDREAMRYTQADASLKACRQRIAAYDWQRRTDGYAPWTIETKGDRRIIGLGGLFNDPFDPGWGTEAAYWFHPSAWGNGYASELLGATMRYADDTLRLPVVNAFAREENVGSRRVLEKAGFSAIRFVPALQRVMFQRLRPFGSAATS